MSDVTVVYIAGQGRSGSTLLDLLLGRLDGWFSMGEFRLFWHARRDEYRCGCGQMVTECPVWSQVIANGDDRPVADTIADFKPTVRLRRVPGLLSPRLLGRHRAARDRAAHTLGDVYRAAADATGARVLVDSSKDPIFGLLLRGVPGVRLFVVHLTRDSRAVAWSWQRKRRRPEIVEKDAYQPVYSALHTALEWDLRNALVHVLGRRAAGYTRVSYESLVRDPDAVVAAIAAAVTGVPAAASDAVVPMAREPDAPNHTAPNHTAPNHTAPNHTAPNHTAPNHTVAGNPMRFATELTVKPDVEWSTALAPRDRRLVTALTWPLLRAYGYV